jgi:DNA-binding beta-propeller fold protein YncE
MKKGSASLVLMCVSLCATFAVLAQSTSQSPLKLIQTLPLPGIQHFEHFGIDAKGNRLFSLAGVQEGRLEVFDLRTGQHLRSVEGLQEGQCLVYRQDLNRLYVVGGGGNLITQQPGRVWIYDGNDYSLIKSLDVPPGAAWCSYDDASHYLYVNGNGRLVHKPDSTVTVIDTTLGEEVGRIIVDDDVLTDLQIDPSGSNLYTGERNKKLIAVIDRNTRKVVARWPVTLGEGLGHMALDFANHRLFVGCRYGQVVIFDTQTGKELQALPISQYPDDLEYDPVSKRLYATCAGAIGVGQSAVDVFQQIDRDHYKLIGQVITEPGARNGIVASAVNRFFVAAPQHEGIDSHLLVFQIQ